MIKVNVLLLFLCIYINAFGQEKSDSTDYLSIKLQLDTILDNDQKYRMQLDSIQETFGSNSKEINALWKDIKYQDSLNLIKVNEIISQYGWLGADKIGKDGNQTLFLVIQHSDKQTMEYYLPIMKDAVLKGDASPKSFAMLQDRVEMLNHRPQVYGTQVQYINEKYVVYRILDPENINKRRHEIGLNDIEEYLKRWNIDFKPSGEDQKTNI